MRENYSDSIFAPAAASRVLRECQESRKNDIKVFDLCDGLLVADIPSVPQRHLSDVMSSDAASGFVKYKETAARAETSRADSEMVTPFIIEKVTENGSERCHVIGVNLRVLQATLTETTTIHAEILDLVLSDWKNYNRQAIVGQLLSAQL